MTTTKTTKTKAGILIPITPKLEGFIQLKQDIIRCMQMLERLIRLEIQELEGLQKDINEANAGTNRVAELRSVK